MPTTLCIEAIETALELKKAATQPKMVVQTGYHVNVPIYKCWRKIIISTYDVKYNSRIGGFMILEDICNTNTVCGVCEKEHLSSISS